MPRRPIGLPFSQVEVEHMRIELYLARSRAGRRKLGLCLMLPDLPSLLVWASGVGLHWYVRVAC